MKNKALLYSLLLTLLLPMAACKETQPGDQAPAIPPTNTMIMEFDQFPSDTTASAGSSTTLSLQSSAVQPQAVTYDAFINATANVAVWSTLLKIGLAIPVAAFKESFRHQPSLRSDNVWVWTYAVKVQGIIHTVELHATLSEDVVDWEMYVTKPGFYLDFNWISGTSARDGSNGSWLIRDNPDAPQPVLDIQWSRDVSQGLGQISYTNVKPNDADNGAYISYGVIDNPDYDAFFDIYQKAKGNLVEIEWNRATHNGRINNPDAFADMNWHYWNELLQDVPAPVAAP